MKNIIILFIILFLIFSCEPEPNDFVPEYYDNFDSNSPLVEGSWEYTGSGTTKMSTTETILISGSNVYEDINSGLIILTFIVDEYENFIDRNGNPGTQSKIRCVTTTDTGVCDIGAIYYNIMILINNTTMRTYFSTNGYPAGEGGEEMIVTDNTGINYMTYTWLD